MPLDAAILAASALGTGLLNAGITSSMNRQTRQFTRSMYDTQRQHALQDWEMQNAYNSPQAQMQRLKSAGLNPNLVYGQGAVANASQGVRSTDSKSWNPQIPQIQTDWLTSALGQTQSIELKKAQMDLARQAIQVQQQKVLESISKIANVNAKTAMSNFQLGQANELKDTVIATAKARANYIEQQTKQSEAQTKYTLNQDERAKLLTAQNLKQGWQNLLLSKQQEIQNEININNSRLQGQNISANTQRTLTETQGILYKQKERISAELRSTEQQTENHKWITLQNQVDASRKQNNIDGNYGPFGVISFLERKLYTLMNE